MCDPVIMTILSVVTTGVSLYAESQTAKAQRNAVNQQAENEREETLEAAEEELGVRIRASRESRARARVAAGESGALGASFAASMNQSISDFNMDAALVSKQVAFTQRGIDDRASIALSQISSPSALSAGLQIASAGVKGFQTGTNIQDRRIAKKKEAAAKKKAEGK